MFENATEKGLQAILEAVDQHIPQHAMKMLEDSIRSYGQMCAHDAMIEYLAKKATNHIASMEDRRRKEA